MEIDRKQILTSVLETIEGISDKEYQKRVWIRGEGPEVDDFDETCCNFFGDGDPLIENYKDFGLTDKQYHLLVKFRDEFDAFCYGPALKHYLPEEFIDTPEWARIMEMAKEVLKAFNYQKYRIEPKINQKQVAEVLSILENISHSQVHQKAPIDKKVRPHAFLEEIMQHLFNDSAFKDVLNNYKLYDLSNEQYYLLKKFYEALTQYLEYADSTQLFKDPKGHQIQEMAKEVLKAFNYQ